MGTVFCLVVCCDGNGRQPGVVQREFPPWVYVPVLLQDWSV